MPASVPEAPVEASSGSLSAVPPVADLRVAPRPRRFARRFTLMVMLVTLVVSVVVAIQLVPEVQYALQPNEPESVGTLENAHLTSAMANRFIQATGRLTRDGLSYERPLQAGEFWLVPVQARPQLWVELHLPAAVSVSEFVLPTSFVGRLVPWGSAGPRYRVLEHAAGFLGAAPPLGAWLLLDGNTPRSSRWSVAACALLFAFALFNLWGIFRLFRRVV